MLRATRATLTIATICGVLAAIASAPAMARPAGTLTHVEFKQLSAAMAELSTSANNKSVDWVKARAACHRIGRVTVLLRTQRTSCLNSMSALEALANFPAEQTKCAVTASPKTGTTTGITTTGTTTTGTTTTTGATTTSAQSAVIRLIICLSPRYHALGRYAGALYKSDDAARKEAVARGFIGACLATLASTPTDLQKEKLFASSSARLAHDVTVLIKVTRRQAPTTDLNQVQIDSDVNRFATAARAILDENGPQKLSACPHR